MKRKRCSPEQTTSILNEREAGALVADLVHIRGIAEQSSHPWKSKRGCLAVSDLRRLRRRVKKTCERSTKIAEWKLDRRVLGGFIEMPEKR